MEQNKVDSINSIMEICHKLYSKEFVAATDGNISVRTSNNTFMITRSGVNKGEVTEKDIIEIDSDGKTISGIGKISTENKLHLYIYKNRTDINSVIHCHPIYTSAFALTGKPISHLVLPEVLLTIGKIAMCEYATPSTDQLPLSLSEYIQDSNVFILRNHGAVAAGANIKQAYYRIEKLEHTAKILLLAHQLGGAKEIPSNKVAELLSIAETVYGIKINEKLV